MSKLILNQEGNGNDDDDNDNQREPIKLNHSLQETEKNRHIECMQWGYG